MAAAYVLTRTVKQAFFFHRGRSDTIIVRKKKITHKRAAIWYKRDNSALDNLIIF